MGMRASNNLANARQSPRERHSPSPSLNSSPAFSPSRKPSTPTANSGTRQKLYENVKEEQGKPDEKSLQDLYTQVCMNLSNIITFQNSYSISSIIEDYYKL